MAQHHDAPVPHGPAYETTDADTRQISIWTMAIFVTIAAGMISMAALLFGFIKFPPALERTPTTAELGRELPPTPRLQVNQSGDLHDFRAREEKALGSYGREPNSGAVRIPIDKAIDIVAARGTLPVSKGAPASAAKPAPAAAAAH